MGNRPRTIVYRTVGEWTFGSGHAYENPFTDVTVDATFISPRGKTFTVPAFYDGDKVWRLRFNPNETGLWTHCVTLHPANLDLTAEGAVEVTPLPARGFLQATPGRAWGFHYESGEPVFLLGDTTYNPLAWRTAARTSSPF